MDIRRGRAHAVGRPRSGQSLLHAPSRFKVRNTTLPFTDVQPDPVRSVRPGTQYTLFLHAYGRVSALGSDAKGQWRGLHPAAVDVQAVGCSWNVSYLQTRAGMLFLAGSNAHRQFGREGASTPSLGPVNVPHNLRVVNFACGSEHVLCVLESGGADGGVGVGVERAWEPGDWVIGRTEGARQDMASVSRASSRREDGRSG